MTDSGKSYWLTEQWYHPHTSVCNIPGFVWRAASLRDFCPCANVTECICTSTDSTAWAVWYSGSFLGYKTLQHCTPNTGYTCNTVLICIETVNRHGRKQKHTNKQKASLSKALTEQGRGSEPEFRFLASIQKPGTGACSCHPIQGQRRRVDPGLVCALVMPCHLPFWVWFISLMSLYIMYEFKPFPCKSDSWNFVYGTIRFCCVQREGLFNQDMGSRFKF